MADFKKEFEKNVKCIPPLPKTHTHTHMNKKQTNKKLVFVFQNFTNDDGGVYKVTAKNESGEGTANITINLQGYVCRFSLV